MISSLELRYRKLLCSGDFDAKREAIRLARRRGENRVIVLEPDSGEELCILDPTRNHCRRSIFFLCGFCDYCQYWKAIDAGMILLDCREDAWRG